MTQRPRQAGAAKPGPPPPPAEPTAPVASAPPAPVASAPPAPVASAPPARQTDPLVGNLDAVHDDGTVIAWCWSSAEPAVRRVVAVLVDGVEAARGRCDQPRPDLVSNGIGDGAHALVLKLPPKVVVPGRRAVVEMRDMATRRQIGAETAVLWAGPAAAVAAPVVVPPPHELHGNLDRVSKDGWISGWCWYPNYPDEHVDLSILIDDEPVGITRAANFRGDLKDAGIGDGTHGFAFALPWSALAEKGTLRVAVRETRGWNLLGDPILLRAGRVAAVEERILDLDRQVRLLRAQLDEAGRQRQARDEERAARDLFATVAAFFQGLADGDPGALPGGGLKHAIEDVTGRLAPIALAIPAAPVATICVGAGAPVDTVYGAIAALREAGVDARADIVLIDDGGHGGEAALLPAVVRNLRYAHVPTHASPLAVRNEVAAGSRGALIGFLAPQARIRPDWLAEIAATFEREPDAAVVGAKAVREDGILHHTGILPGAGGALRDPGRFAADGDPEYDFLRPVFGFGDVAVVLRRDMMAEAGGFATGFAGADAAMLDLCLRLRQSGRQVLYQPLAVAIWSDGGEASLAPVPDLSLGDEDARRLQLTLEADPAPAPQHRGGGLFAGHALVIDGALATRERMLLVRRLDYRVTVAAAAGGAPPPAGDAATLRRRGIEVMWPPHHDSAIQYLEAFGAGLDLVEVQGEPNPLLLDRVRELAPQAKLVFAPPPLESGAHEQALQCIRHSDATILASEADHDLLKPAAGKLWLLRGILHPAGSANGFAARDGIGCIGDFSQQPNVAGLQWFVAKVLPLVLRELPGLRLHIAGSNLPGPVRALASANIVIGDGTAALFDTLRLSVAPRAGEVAASLAHGVPVVGTASALQGTGFAPGEGIVVADDAKGFAAKVVRLHRDEAAWAALSATALQRCRALYSPEAALDIYRQLLTDLQLPAPAA